MATMTASNQHYYANVYPASDASATRSSHMYEQHSSQAYASHSLYHQQQSQQDLEAYQSQQQQQAAQMHHPHAPPLYHGQQQHLSAPTGPSLTQLASLQQQQQQQRAALAGSGQPSSSPAATAGALYSSLEATKSTKGASKMRRDLINTEIAQLRELLPLPASTRQRLSQLQLMALVLVYVRKSNYFCNGKFPAQHLCTVCVRRLACRGRRFGEPSRALHSRRSALV